MSKSDALSATSERGDTAGGASSPHGGDARLHDDIRDREAVVLGCLRRDGFIDGVACQVERAERPRREPCGERRDVVEWSDDVRQLRALSSLFR